MIVSERENQTGQTGINFGFISLSNLYCFLFVKSRQTSWRRRLYLSVDLNEVPRVKKSVLRIGGTAMN